MINFTRTKLIKKRINYRLLYNKIYKNIIKPRISKGIMELTTYPLLCFKIFDKELKKRNKLWKTNGYNKTLKDDKIRKYLVQDTKNIPEIFNKCKYKKIYKDQDVKKQIKVWDSLIHLRIQLQKTLKTTNNFSLTDDLSKIESKIFFPILKKINVIQVKLWSNLGSKKKKLDKDDFLSWKFSLPIVNEMIDFWQKELFNETKTSDFSLPKQTFSKEISLSLDKSYLQLLTKSRVKQPRNIFDNKIKLKQLIEKRVGLQIYNDITFYQLVLKEYLSEKKKDVYMKQLKISLKNYFHKKINNKNKKKDINNSIIVKLVNFMTPKVKIKSTEIIRKQLLKSLFQ